MMSPNNDTHPVLVGYILWILRFHRLPPLLLRQADHRHHLVLHWRPAADWLDYRRLLDPWHGSPG